jgi:hypothetical protein
MTTAAAAMSRSEIKVAARSAPRGSPHRNGAGGCRRSQIRTAIGVWATSPTGARACRACATPRTLFTATAHTSARAIAAGSRAAYAGSGCRCRPCPARPRRGALPALPAPRGADIADGCPLAAARTSARGSTDRCRTPIAGLPSGAAPVAEPVRRRRRPASEVRAVGQRRRQRAELATGEDRAAGVDRKAGVEPDVDRPPVLGRDEVDSDRRAACAAGDPTPQQVRAATSVRAASSTTLPSRAQAKPTPSTTSSAMPARSSRAGRSRRREAPRTWREAASIVCASAAGSSARPRGSTGTRRGSQAPASPPVGNQPVAGAARVPAHRRRMRGGDDDPAASPAPYSSAGA